MLERIVVFITIGLMRSFFFVFFLLTHAAIAQTFKTDTVFISQAKENAVQRYNDQLSGQTHLMNGSRVVRIEPAFKPLDKAGITHPYYSLEWISGEVLYSGEWYNSAFRYDLNKDKLIIPGIDERGQTQLVSEKIEQFTLGTHRFVQLKQQRVPEGFYEIIYDGITKAFIRLQKAEETKFKNNKLVAEFIPKASYYIKINNTFYEVKSKASVLRLFSEKKPELKKFLRSQSQPFGKNKGFFIREMARIYDQPITTE